MDSDSYLVARGDDAKRNDRTPPALRDLIFRSVDQAAKKHYPEDYPMKCLQCAAATQRLLRRAGIESQLWCGAMCAAEVFEDPTAFGWGGFWDKDHHIWLVTQFHELVDLSIGRLHQHPRRKRADGIPMPPVWWTEIARWPPVLRYLPDSPAGIRLEPQDSEDLDRFLSEADLALDAFVLKGETGMPPFGSILAGPQSMNELYDEGNPWVVRSLMFQERSISFPDWILEREEELIRAHQTGKIAPSRLAGTIEMQSREASG